MTTSCCPAYVGWVDKHAPMVKPFVSDTRSPMVYAARRVKAQYPDAEVGIHSDRVLAKRYEAEMHVPGSGLRDELRRAGSFHGGLRHQSRKTCEELPLGPGSDEIQPGDTLKPVVFADAIVECRGERLHHPFSRRAGQKEPEL